MTKEHKKITGEELTENSVCYCEQFDNGGMSHGFISGMFWVKPDTQLSVYKEYLRVLGYINTPKGL